MRQPIFLLETAAFLNPVWKALGKCHERIFVKKSRSKTWLELSISKHLFSLKDVFKFDIISLILNAASLTSITVSLYLI